MTLIENVISWCKQEHKSLTDQINLMNDGKLRVLSQTLGSPEVDLTADSINDCKRKIAELDDIISRYPEIR